MFIPIPLIWFVITIIAALVALLIISELQIKALNRTFWRMADNARESQQTTFEMGRLARQYEQALRFYADEENWESMADSTGADGVPVCTTCLVVEDGGQIAIRALKGDEAV